MFKENRDKIETVIKTGATNDSSRLNGPQRLKECTLILIVCSSVFLSIALFSFNPADPSWSQTAWGAQIENSAGWAGAWMADTLFFVFGSLAYIIPAVLTVTAWVMLRKRNHDEPIDFMLWGTRLLGLTILILTSCGLADINFDDIWYFSSGGVIGDVLTSLALPTLNVLGTTLVLLFLWGAGFTLLTGISWLSIVEWIGSGVIAALVWLFNAVRGEKAQTLKPELMEPLAEQEQPTLSDDAASQEKQKHYQIHVPQSQAAEDEDVVDPLMASREVEQEPIESLVEPVEERTRQLTSTIAELEEEAKEHDDFAREEAPTREFAEQDVLEPEANDTPAQIEQDLPWQVETDEVPATPAIDMAELESISQDLEDKDQVTPTLESTDEIEPVDDQKQDQDVEAFQELVAQAQATEAAKQNPFLVQKEADLPVPTDPMPTLELLYHPEKRDNFIDRDALEEIARLVESKLADYKITASVVGIFPGPVITRFELDLAPGVKVSRISGLSMDLARSLSAMAVRVVEVIPGKPYVGLELPNMSRQTVYLSDVINSPQFIDAKSPTTVVLGQDIAGEAVVADLSKMPHVLVAGTTGSGKSVGVNVMILSMLYKATPEEVRFIMIDPKMLELSVYEGIPHLLSEVVTDMKDASNALRWCVGEMERRYKLMSVLGVRNIKGYNDKLKMAAEAGHPIHDPLWQPGDSMDEEAPLLETLHILWWWLMSLLIL